MKVHGKVVVVTGAGSGLGRELALELLRRGARVAAVDRSADALAETEALAAAGSAFASFVLDVTDRPGLAALPERVLARFGVVDGLINNAGIIQPFVHLQDLDEATIDRVMAVNLYGPLHLIRAFLPHLLARPEAHVANVSSMGGFLPVPGQTMYGASKAALKLMTEGLWAELRDTGVRVTLVLPGAVATNILQNSGVEVPNPGGGARGQAPRAADVAAREVLDAIERDAFRVLVGRDAKAMDLAYRAGPRRAVTLVANRMRDLLPKR